MDPKYMVDKIAINTRTQNTTSATGSEYIQNLDQFAKKRPDIFGTIEEQFLDESKKRNTSNIIKIFTIYYQIK